MGYFKKLKGKRGKGKVRTAPLQTLDFIGRNDATSRRVYANAASRRVRVRKLFSEFFVIAHAFAHTRGDSRKSAQPERKQSIVNEIPGIGPVNEIGIAQRLERRIYT